MLKLNSIYNVDCVAGMQKLKAGSVDLVFADPPFNIGYEYDVYDDRKERQHYLEWSREWISGVHRALSPTGTFWLAIGDEYAAELKIMAQEIGFTCRSWVIWYYTFGVNCKRKFSRSHAHLFHFVKDNENFTFNLDDPAVRIPSARQLVYADGRANPRGRLPDDTWILRPQDLPEGFSEESDTWYFPRVAGTFKERAGFHGCQMPEQLLGRIIRVSSNGGKKPDLVLDPFSGSATTLVVAKKLGRDYLGFDLSKDYVQRGTARLKKVKSGDLLEGAAQPTRSAPATPDQPRERKRRFLVKKVTASDSEPKEAPAATVARVSRAAKRATPKTAAQPIVEKKVTTPEAFREKSPRKGPAATSSSTDLSAGIVEAFQACNDGYSADRVIADPQINQEFARHCQRLGLAGGVKDWNIALFGLRKNGRLTGLRTSRQTEFDWEAADRFLFASEIALTQIEMSATLDRALCDPELAAQFDRTAASFAPGFSPFEYRWAALRVRKEFALSQKNARLVGDISLETTLRLGEGAYDKLRGTRGVYLFSSSPSRSGALFVGETLDLGNVCASAMNGGGLRDAWRSHASKLFLWYTALDASHSDTAKFRFARTARLVAEYAPRLNYRPAIAAQAAVV